MGTLYVVATPIGNLEDITLRALRVLGEVSLIAAEDTRAARILLSRHHISAPRVVSYFDGNRRRRIPEVLGHLATAGDVAVISEAGTPGISDPGAALVQAAVAGGHTIVPLPGPTAGVALLSASGLPGDRFVALGFLPRRSAERRTLLLRIAELQSPIVAYESPHRFVKSLADMVQVFGPDQPIVVGRELTKRYEEIWHGTLAGATDYFQQPRGEFTIVIPVAQVKWRSPRPDAHRNDDGPPRDPQGSLQGVSDPLPPRSRRSRPTTATRG